MKRRRNETVTRSGLMAAILGCGLSNFSAIAQDVFPLRGTSPAFADSASDALIHLPFAQFQIPFSVDARGPVPTLVQLWVSTDNGTSWQLHGSANPNARQFPFRAASEGMYQFSVRTVDEAGTTYAAGAPPLHVNVDTTKPVAAVRADIDASGSLVIDVRVADQFLDAASATLKLRTDRESDWRDVSLPTLALTGEYYESQARLALPACREVAVVFAVKDQAGNAGEATYRLTMPRTAKADADLRLASSADQLPSSESRNQVLNVPGMDSLPDHPRTSLVPLHGATEWKPESSQTRQPAHASGQLAATDRSVLGTSEADRSWGVNGAGPVEELPPPPPAGERPVATRSQTPVDALSLEPQSLEPQSLEPQSLEPQSPSQSLPADRLGLDDSGFPSTDPRNPLAAAEPIESLSLGQAYHCQSRAFSLDYSVESLGGAALADVELWGSEDGGQQWNKWGSDPDRQSPFDIQVGNDGLFGFRMVIVGANGIVSNRPRAGDPADVWINVDTSPPSTKITRAVYGEGPETGMLVIDYQCNDSHLVDRPVSLAYSDRPDGPWTTFATGLKNSGIYLWKANPALPDRIYLKIDVVDKAGNVGTHQLNLPIDTKGLAPRGRIHGFRPIAQPSP